MTHDPSMNGNHRLPQDTAEQLEAIISDLAADARPHIPPGNAELADLVRVAGTLRGALQPVAAPDPTFARTLRDRLEADLFGDASLKVAAAPPAAPAPRQDQPQRRASSRRQLMRGGLVAAAGVAAGIVAGVEVGHQIGNAAPPNTGPWTVPLVGGAGTWLTVAQVAEVAAGAAVRFNTAQVVGHLVRYADGTFAAFAAACTHMGCIVDWDAATHTFDCPCHNGRFDAHGQAIPGRITYRPLPQMQTRILAGAVQVYVPTASEANENGTYGP